MSEETPNSVLARLRQRLLDLQKTNMMTPESFGTYQQSMLQLWNECERRAMTCFDQVQSLQMQAKASEHQAHAFRMMGSIILSVVNGYVDKEEQRVREEAERAKEQAEKEREAKKLETRQKSESKKAKNFSIPTEEKVKSKKRE